MKHWQSNKDDVWSDNTIKDKVKKACNCNWADDEISKKEIHIPDGIYDVIKYLCQEIKVEWQLFLCGEEHEGFVMINDYYIPRQKVTGSTVINQECVDQQFIDEHSVIANIHSHSNMDVFFSNVDEQTNMGPIKYHIVINNKYNYKAVQQVHLPCGMISFAPIPVVFGHVKDIEVKGMDRIETKKIKMSDYTSQLPLEYDRVHAIERN